MGGGGVIIILKRNIKTALQLGLNPSGSVKVWHALVASHALSFVGGWLL